MDESHRCHSTKLDPPVRCRCGRVLGYFVEVSAEATNPTARETFCGYLDAGRYDIDVHDGFAFLRPHVGDRFFVKIERQQNKTPDGRKTIHPRRFHGTTKVKCPDCDNRSIVKVC